jgi:hypothetical protein
VVRGWSNRASSSAASLIFSYGVSRFTKGLAMSGRTLSNRRAGPSATLCIWTICRCSAFVRDSTNRRSTEPGTAEAGRSSCRRARCSRSRAPSTGTCSTAGCPTRL